MNYQAIRAAVESPLLTAFNNLDPAVPVYFDNITAVPPNTTTEYVRINVTFGLTSDLTLTSSVRDVRGALVVRVFSEKGRGPARNQELVNTAMTALKTLKTQPKTISGVFARVGNINGPNFSAVDATPHFVGRLDAGYTATQLTRDYILTTQASDLLQTQAGQDIVATLSTI